MSNNWRGQRTYVYNSLEQNLKKIFNLKISHFYNNQNWIEPLSGRNGYRHAPKTWCSDYVIVITDKRALLLTVGTMNTENNFINITAISMIP